MKQEERLMAYAERTLKLKRLNVSVDEELHTLLKVAVAKQQTTICQFVVEAIKEKIERDSKQGDNR